MPLAMSTGTIRLFVEPDLAPGAEFAATALQAHYLGAVMRRGAGDPVILFNGRDGEYLARLASIKRDQARFIVDHQLRPQAVRPPLALVFAPLKRDATDLVIQKATELGATAIHPVITARSNTQRVNLDRFRAITIEAAEQCERMDLPELHPPVPLFNLLGQWPATQKLAACIERADAAPLRGGMAQGILIGPEGGFSSAELDVMRRASFVIPVSLGSLILRAETAVIAGLALLQAPS